MSEELIQRLLQENAELKIEIANLTLQVKELAQSLKTYIECAESCPVKTN